MRKELGTFIAGVALAGAVVGGAVALDGPSKGVRYAGEVGSPVACLDPTCGTPVALPTVAVPTAEPTVFVDTLPETGTGSSR